MPNTEKISHKLNKEEFLEQMKSRGWIFDYRGWIAPSWKTKAQMEQDWIDSIEESIECLYSMKQGTQVKTTATPKPKG